MDYNNTYNERQSRDNHAESICIDKFGDRLIRFGFDEKKKRIKSSVFWMMDPFLRSIPDFIIDHSGRAYFMEAKGFKGKFLKLKLNDLDAYHWWRDSFRSMGFVFFLVNFSDKIKTAIVPLEKIDGILNKCEVLQYEDSKKKYYNIPIGEI